MKYLQCNSTCHDLFPGNVLPGQGEFQILAAQHWLFVTKEWPGMEGKKGLTWLGTGMSETGGISKEGRFPLVMREEMTQCCLVAIRWSWTVTGATYGQHSCTGGWIQCWADISYTDVQRIGAGARVPQESAHVTPVQTPIRTACGSRTLSNALCAKAFILKHKLVLIPQGWHWSSVFSPFPMLSHLQFCKV